MIKNNLFKIVYIIEYNRSMQTKNVFSIGGIAQW